MSYAPPHEETMLKPIWKELYNLNSQPIYLKDKDEKFEQDIKDLLKHNRLFLASNAYLSNDIQPIPKYPFIKANRPAERLAMGYFTN